MRAILLAAGYGTRLRPLTNTIPKCLVPIKGRPLLGIWLERLTQVGIGPFLVNTHYLAEQVQEFVSNSPYRDQVKLVHEPTLLGTAGTLMANLDFFQGKDGMLIHADNYCLANFQEFAEAHRKRPAECVMTMMTFRTPTPSTCGILELDDRGVVVEFHEKVANPPGDLASGAIYLLSSEFLEIASNQFKPFTDFSTQIIPSLMGRIYSFRTENTFIDIGDRQSYDRANS
ncbi:nucleotidyltransferase family protein [Cylindrospermopsis raciborskii]|uniref:nucleotidyltransferase family protein n=1 Tax=Cylindrospermopsis raciborskii TaxID=77022 RepID=UPI0008DC6B35|nr:nucleotidyltransferase family protein [Cylindrospermopsis raciborskii]NLQ05631.1 nucleotidyltransferase family protein [Cylindrospermopsis raciborskii MVCC19]OHY34212.1 nucleotidyl transferase [Cylindrospermopsis raciborskii MVCC14]